MTPLLMLAVALVVLTTGLGENPAFPTFQLILGEGRHLLSARDTGAPAAKIGHWAGGT